LKGTKLRTTLHPFYASQSGIHFFFIYSLTLAYLFRTGTFKYRHGYSHARLLCHCRRLCAYHYRWLPDTRPIFSRSPRFGDWFLFGLHLLHCLRRGGFCLPPSRKSCCSSLGSYCHEDDDIHIDYSSSGKKPWSLSPFSFSSY
jgi:hypothetical protein